MLSPEQIPKEIPFGRLVHVLSRKLKRDNLMDYPVEELTPMQKQVLKFILLSTLHHPIYQKDVEEEFQIRRSTATGILQLMEKNGFIIRQSTSFDKRLKEIIPTQKSERLREKLIKQLQLREEKMLSGIPPEHISICKSVLKQVLNNLDELKK